MILMEKYIFLLLFITFLQYELRLTASDSYKENYTTVLINIKDVNDNPPVFEKSSYRTQITEEDDRGLPKRVLKVIFHNKCVSVVRSGDDDGGGGFSVSPRASFVSLLQRHRWDGGA